MIKKILLFVFLCSLVVIKAQVFQSAFKAAELDRVNAFVDSQGNIIITGHEPYLSSAGDTTAYHVIKYSPQGIELWRRTLASPLNVYMNPTILNDHMYVVGSFQTRLHFAGTFTASAGDYDACYVHIDPNGTMTVKTEGNTGREFLFGLCTLNNQLYAVGSASGQVQLNNSNYTYSTQAAFMEKMDTGFNPLWIKWGFSANNAAVLGGIQRSNNNLFAFGAANMTWDQGPTIGTFNYNLIKFDDSGNYLAEFPSVYGVMYHGAAFIAEGSNNEIYYMNCYWGSKNSTYNSELHAMNANKLSKWVANTGSMTCSDRSVLLKNNTLFWYNGHINTSEIQNGGIISRIPLQQPLAIGEGYLGEYMGDQLLFYGTFFGTTSFGNTTLVSGSKTTAFVTILNSNVILSAKEYFKAEPKIYPNPASSILQIETGGLSGDAAITILSISGAELMRVNAKDLTEINIENLSPGMYLLKVEDTDGCYIQKIVKD